MRIGLTVRSLPLAIATSRAGDHLPLTRASFNLRQTAASRTCTSAETQTLQGLVTGESPKTVRAAIVSSARSTSEPSESPSGVVVVTPGFAQSFVAIRMPGTGPTALGAVRLPLAISRAEVDTDDHRVSGRNLAGLDVVPGEAAPGADARARRAHEIPFVHTWSAMLLTVAAPSRACCGSTRSVTRLAFRSTERDVLRAISCGRARCPIPFAAWEHAASVVGTTTTSGLVQRSRARLPATPADRPRSGTKATPSTARHAPLGHG